VRLVDLSDGRVLRQHSAGSSYFAEGLAKHNGTLYQLAWQVSDVLRCGVERDLTLLLVTCIMYARHLQVSVVLRCVLA
jgi:glutamine cyclotransferase